MLLINRQIQLYSILQNYKYKSPTHRQQGCKSSNCEIYTLFLHPKVQNGMEHLFFEIHDRTV